VLASGLITGTNDLGEWPLGFDGFGPRPVDGAVDRGSPDAEEFGELSLGVVPGVVQLKEMLGLVRLQLRLPTAQPALCLGNLHPFASAQSDQVGFDYVDSCGLSSRMTGRREPFPMVELWPVAVRVHQTRALRGMRARFSQRLSPEPPRTVRRCRSASLST
jgi:hypothetical protein